MPAEQGAAAAVDRLDVQLRAGERVGMVGESGSGKSLTALALLGFAPPGGRLEGRVDLDGSDLLTLDDDALRDLRGRRIAYVPQEPADALDPLLRVGYQLREAIKAHSSTSIADADADAEAEPDKQPAEAASTAAGAGTRPDAEPGQRGAGQATPGKAGAERVLNRPVLNRPVTTRPAPMRAIALQAMRVVATRALAMLAQARPARRSPSAWRRCSRGSDWMVSPISSGVSRTSSRVARVSVWPLPWPWRTSRIC